MKTILITGAGGNLGTHVVNYFADRGYRVLAFVSPGKSPNQQSNPNINFIEVDLRDETASTEQVNRISQQYAIDAAFLLAGGFAMGTLEQTTLQEVHHMIQVNFDTVYSIVRPLYSVMNRQPQGGKLVFIGALPAVEWGSSSAMLGYALSKAMLINLAQSLNAAASSNKILTAVLVPSIIDTPANRAAMPQANYADWVKPEGIAQQLESILIHGVEGHAAVIKL
jgi:NAD(P)-dependent dehydrogenase (short-subunit alcohol dehydrogenase family)